jgi:serine/threonine protein kinase
MQVGQGAVRRSHRMRASENKTKPLIDQIFIEYKGVKEILDVYSASGNIVKHVLNNNALCNLVNKKDSVKFRKLGQGAYGTVYSITFPGMENQKYVVKTYKSIEPLSTDLDCQISKANQNDFTIFGTTKTLLTKKSKSYVALNGRKYPINVPKSYLCGQEKYSEYIIGVLVGQLYRNGMRKAVGPFCINFLDVFDFTTCYKPKEKQYIFMQQIDTTLDKLVMSSWSLDAQTFIFMQILLSIYVYQSMNISHNDLKPDNIFMQKITGDTMYNGQHLLNADYLEYKLPNGDSFYLSVPDDNAYIVKIGDWGQSIKYGMKHEPTVGNFSVFYGEFNGYTQNMFGEAYANTPNWFAPAYDLVTFLNILIHLNIFPGTADNWLTWVVGNNPGPHDEYFRPLNKYVDIYKSIKDVLYHKEFEHFRTYPSNKELHILPVADLTVNGRPRPGKIQRGRSSVPKRT